jgi:hypothetical protein
MLISVHAVEKLCAFLATADSLVMNISFVNGSSASDKIAAAAVSNPALSGLVIYNEDYDDLCDSELVIKALAANTTLVGVVVSNFNCCRFGVETFFDSLAHNKTLRCLSMSGCALYDKGNALAAGLAANGTLTALRLVRCDLTGIEPLIASIAANKTLRLVNFSRNSIGPVCIQALHDMVETHPSLTEVVVDNDMWGICCEYGCSSCCE